VAQSQSQSQSETILGVKLGDFCISEYARGEIENDTSGVSIRTDRQTITLGIGNYQSCCEVSGYFLSEDDPQTFVGAKLLNITITDDALRTYDFMEHGLYNGGCMFVNLETDRGTLQFVAYNIHNGYYGHRATVRSQQLTLDKCL
jgi:hypothetical protein